MRTALPTNVTPRIGRRRVGVALAVAGALALAAGCGTSTSASSPHGAGHGGGHGNNANPMPSADDMHDMHGMDEMGVHPGDPGNGLLSTEDGYTLKPSSTVLSVGRQTLRFQVLDSSGMPQTQYVEDQTKPLHFYLVRLDLTGYQHLHPTLKDGTWSVDVEAAAPGPYRMYTDFIAKDASGAEHPLVLSAMLTAPGTYTPVPLPAASTTASADGLTATLTGTLRAGVASKVTFEVSEDGKPLADLQPYLDSFAHLTALHAGDAAYRHIHPELTADAGQKGGPSLPFTIELPEKGTWRLFLQVQRAGTLHLLPLTVTVS
jgi:hypothetical protein